MTVKELKEKLNQFNDNLIVMIPNGEFYSGDSLFECVAATNVYQGVNEFDDCVFIDDYEEDDDDKEDTFAQNKCSGCVYEDADGSTEDIGNCVCCSRINDSAKEDSYEKSR